MCVSKRKMSRGKDGNGGGGLRKGKQRLGEEKQRGWGEEKGEEGGYCQSIWYTCMKYLYKASLPSMVDIYQSKCHVTLRKVDSMKIIIFSQSQKNKCHVFSHLWLAGVIWYKKKITCGYMTWKIEENCVGKQRDWWAWGGKKTKVRGYV